MIKITRMLSFRFLGAVYEIDGVFSELVLVFINNTNCFIFDDHETRNGYRAYIY